jgi:hypothetical protein
LVGGFFVGRFLRPSVEASSSAAGFFGIGRVYRVPRRCVKATTVGRKIALSGERH